MIAMIQRYLLAGVAAVAVALGAYAWWQQSRAVRLAGQLEIARASVMTLTRAAEQAAEANAVNRAHLARMEAELAASAAEIEGLMQMEGRDAPLSPLLRASGAAADRIVRQ